MAQADDRDTITQNRAFDLLSNARRRFVLHYLSRHEGPVELRELADELAKWETGSESITRQERKRVYVSLYQTHIPRLADAGVIEYDSDAGVVQLVDRGRNIDRYISAPGDETAWPLYYLAIAALGIAFYALSLLGTVPFVPEWVGGAFVLGLLLAVSVVHLYTTRRRRSIRLGREQFIDGSEE